jgi:hypothetical protein
MPIESLSDIARGETSAFASGSGVATDDPRLSDAREWTAPTVTQPEIDAGVSTERRAWSVEMIKQATSAWFFSVTSGFGRAWTSLADAAAARDALGLGTAATQNVQTSSTDTTTNALLGVTSFGLGALSSVSYPKASMDTEDCPVGFYRIASTVPGTWPITAFTGCILVERVSTSQIKQTLSKVQSGEIWIRQISSGVPSTWVSVLTGIKSQTSTTDATAGALLTVDSFGIGTLGFAPNITDLDATTLPAGLYRFANGGTGTKPTGAAANGLVFLERYSSTIAKQTWTNIVGGSAIAPRTWVRTSYAAATWGGWSEVATGGGASSAVASYTTTTSTINLSAETLSTINITLTQDITSLTMPPGSAGNYAESRLVFIQSNGGGWKIADSVWASAGVTFSSNRSPVIATRNGDITYLTLFNSNNTGWTGISNVPRTIGGAPIARTPATARYIVGARGGTALTTLASGLGKVWYLPFVAPRNMFIETLGFATTVTTAATFRLGVYANDGSAQYDGPGTLLSSGSIATSSTGTKLVTVNQYLAQGERYWVALASSASVTVRAVAVAGQGADLGFLDNATTGVGAFSQASGATGALPSPATAYASLGNETASLVAIYLNEAI